MWLQLEKKQINLGLWNHLYLSQPIMKVCLAKHLSCTVCRCSTMPSNVITPTPSLIAPCHALQTNFSSLFTHNEGLDVPYIYLHNLNLLFGVTERGRTREKGGWGRWTIQKTKTKHKPCLSLANSAHTCTTLRRRWMSLIEQNEF